jgi:viroplasmin and RNaseH domain-containing protein
MDQQLAQQLARIEQQLARMENNQDTLLQLYTMQEQRRLDAIEEARLRALPTFYAVARGRIPGIYATHQESNAQTSGFGGAIQRMFHSMAAAMEFMAANSDAPPQPVYAVARGRVPGVYATAQQANEQTLGFAGARMRRVPTMEEALEYNAANADPHPVAPVARPVFFIDRDGHDDMND